MAVNDTRYMLAELNPKPDQVTLAVNTSQMNIMDLMIEGDFTGTTFENLQLQAAYENMVTPSNPSWHREHIRRLVGTGIQPHFFRGMYTSSNWWSA